MSEHPFAGLNGNRGDEAAREAKALAVGCTMCGACVRECAFLQRYGLPGDLAGRFLATQGPQEVLDPYACSLCGLCSAVCPEGLSPERFFLELRRVAVRRGAVNLRPYRRLLAYETRGRSPWLTWRRIPSGCRTVFFPGCALPGSHPQAVRRLVHTLREVDPFVGIVLDCCTKPSHDLGLQHIFERNFLSLVGFLEKHSVRRVLTACPSCHKIFRTYAQGLETVTVWEAEGFARLLASGAVSGDVLMHDPCPYRQVPEAREAVRKAVRRLGLSVREPKRAGDRTLCCGEGGAVGSVAPDLARRWAERRKAEADGQVVVAACAGCTAFLRRSGLQAVHLADFIQNPVRAAHGRTLAARSPRTYWNRWRLKKSLIKIYGAP